MSRIPYHNDPVSRRVIRLLLVVQVAAMVTVLRLNLLGRFYPAAVISFLTLLVLIAAFLWLYARYWTLPVVREKRGLENLVFKFQNNLQEENRRIAAAIRQRAQLVQAEKDELQAALQMLQKKYIERSLASASLQEAAVPGVGPKLKERLAGYGIVSAAQVSNRIANLPGFGMAKCLTLLSWRSAVAATLESRKPMSLPLEQSEAIKHKYQAQHNHINAIERNAMASKQVLEHELPSLWARLRQLTSITFKGYLSNSLASRRVVAALIAFVLIVTQIVSSVSAALAFGSWNAAASIETDPAATETSTVTPVPWITSEP